MTHKENKDTKHELQSANKPPQLLVDVDFYDSIIDDPEVSAERKRELIEVITSIVVSFIDIGFGVHPVQLAQAGAARTSAIISKTIEEGTFERSEA